MAELYTIKAQTLTDAADSIRRYTSSQNPYILNMAVDGGNGVIIPGAVTIHYREYIDAPINSYDGMIAPDGCDVVVAYDYLRNKNTGLVVPVLYKTQSESEYEDIPDTEQPMYYEGKAVVDGVAYNKWRLIDDKEFLWDGTAKKYIYTNVIVSVKGNINPTEFPSKIGEVYNAGYDKGYDNGYIEGEKSAVDSPLPIPIETEAKMNALLANATVESVGAVYKYTGNTTDTYEHGALYIIAEE